MPDIGRITAVLVLVAVVTLAACGDDGGVSTAASEKAFCDAWNAAMTAGDDSAFDDVLADAPAEIGEVARVVRQADASDENDSPEAEAAAAELLNWTELNCQQDRPGVSTRRVAPPIEAVFDGLTFCGTTVWPESPSDGRTGMVLYGEAGAQDPYDGPMLGLLWNPVDGANHSGDGDAQPVTVRGQSGVAAPITVFQQTILPEVGTVIAWTEGDRAFGLYGRRWPIERAHELVEIADRIPDVSGDIRIGADALPTGYREVFAGDPGVTSLIFAPSPIYSLRFQSDDGILTLNGLQMRGDEFNAFRFFTIGVDQGVVAEHENALVGNAWSADGPAVVTWREPDGLVVRIVGLSVPLESALEVAERSQALSEVEWAALVESDSTCPVIPGGS